MKMKNINAHNRLVECTSEFTVKTPCILVKNINYMNLLINYKNNAIA